MKHRIWRWRRYWKRVLVAHLGGPAEFILKKTTGEEERYSCMPGDSLSITLNMCPACRKRSKALFHKGLDAWRGGPLPSVTTDASGVHVSTEKAGRP